MDRVAVHGAARRLRPVGRPAAEWRGGRRQPSPVTAVMKRTIGFLAVATLLMCGCGEQIRLSSAESSSPPSPAVDQSRSLDCAGERGEIEAFARGIKNSPFEQTSDPRHFGSSAELLAASPEGTRLSLGRIAGVRIARRTIDVAPKPPREVQLEASEIVVTIEAGEESGTAPIVWAVGGAEVVNAAPAVPVGLDGLVGACAVFVELPPGSPVPLASRVVAVAGRDHVPISASAPFDKLVAAASAIDEITGAR